MLALVVILIIGAMPLCLIGGIFLSFYVKERRTTALVNRVPTSTAAAVATMPPGQLVEVKGTLRCPKPLRSELAGQPCAFYRSWVERTYRQDERDDDGTWSTVERTGTLGANARMTPFYVEDGTGRVRVIPDGASVDTRSVFDDFQQQPAKARMRLGGKTVDLNYGMDTIGYRFREEILPIDAPVYVLGVIAEGGEIVRPPKGLRDATFIISYRSEEAIAGPPEGDRLVLWCGAGAMAGGMLLMTIGIVVGLLWV